MFDMSIRTPELIRDNPSWMEDAIRHFRECYPREGCGLFLATGFKAIENIATDPEQEFEMPEDTLAIYDPIAIIHSHPNGPDFPSAADMQCQPITAVPWCIVSLTEETVQEPVWFGDELPVMPLLERPFIYGVFDCFTVIRDFYRLERNIVLEDIPRDWGWWDEGKEVYLDNFQRLGFEEFDPNEKEIQVGDCFMMRLQSRSVNHAGIYVGNGLIIHHAYGSLSHRASLQLWARRIDRWVRYKG